MIEMKKVNLFMGLIYLIFTNLIIYSNTHQGEDKC